MASDRQELQTSVGALVWVWDLNRGGRLEEIENSGLRIPKIPKLLRDMISTQVRTHSYI